MKNILLQITNYFCNESLLGTLNSNMVTKGKLYVINYMKYLKFLQGKPFMLIRVK